MHAPSQRLQKLLRTLVLGQFLRITNTHATSSSVISPLRFKCDSEVTNVDGPIHRIKNLYIWTQPLSWQSLNVRVITGRQTSGGLGNNGLESFLDHSEHTVMTAINSPGVTRAVLKHMRQRFSMVASGVTTSCTPTFIPSTEHRSSGYQINTSL